MKRPLIPDPPPRWLLYAALVGYIVALVAVAVLAGAFTGSHAG